MSYTNNPYCTLDQVVSALDLSPTAQIEDGDWISNDLIPQAQAAIDGYLGFKFQTDGTVGSPSTYTFSGNATNMLRIKERCVSFSQVLDEDGADITSDCRLGPPNTVPGRYLIRKSCETFSVGVQNYTVVGVFGRPEIPQDITRACVRIAVAWYKMRDSNYGDYIIEGMVRQHYQRTLPDDVKEFLDKYKPRAFGA